MEESAPPLKSTSSVRNTAPAKLQITAEQLLRDALEYKEPQLNSAQRTVADFEELQDYRLDKRKSFEDLLRRQRYSIKLYIKYAKWEASQIEFDRCRSIFERGLEIDYQAIPLWLNYAETEMKHRFINRARNIWNRAVSLLPRVDQLWLKFSLMEEQLGNIEGTRQIFERWMKWRPEPKAWFTYANFELRQENLDNARYVYERLITCHPMVDSYLSFAKFEERHGSISVCRKVFERCPDELGEIALASAKYFLNFARFEERHGETERAKAIYELGLEFIKDTAHISGIDKDSAGSEVHKDAAELHRRFILFQKQHGSVDQVDALVLERRRLKYEELLQKDSAQYGVWFDYIRLEEDALEEDFESIREVFERAIGNIPVGQEKKNWKEYMYLWIWYALFEEMRAKDIERARAVYRTALEVIPHELFTFAKLWVLFAKFEIRQMNLTQARKILGTSIGKCPKPKLFSEYIDIELALGNADRCRILYEKFVEFGPQSSSAWIQFAHFEQSLYETERARAIFELALEQDPLDSSEALWKAYIEFEIDLDAIEAARVLYGRLLDQSHHVQIFISFAIFEASYGETERARDVFERAQKYFKLHNKKEERFMIFEAWLSFEREHGDKASIASLQEKMPTKTTQTRPLYAEDGSENGWEEVYDIVFPDEEKAGLSILQAAKQWSKRRKPDS